MGPETGQTHVYAGDEPVNESDPSGDYDCGHRSPYSIVNTYSRAGVNYNLYCGSARSGPDTGFGVRHIQEDPTSQGYLHFDGTVSDLLRKFLIRQTIERGRIDNQGGLNIAYQRTFVVSSNSPNLPEPEVFDIRVVVRSDLRSVVTTYSPGAGAVDRNPLDGCHFAGVDICGGFSAGATFQSLPSTTDASTGDAQPPEGGLCQDTTTSTSKSFSTT